MSKETDIRDLKSKVQSLLANASFSDADFVHWLAAYAKRGNEILNPPQPNKPLTEDQQTDRLAGWRRFANCQKVVDFCQAHKLILDHSSFWWWLASEERGYISGLESEADKLASRGIARITNGIDLWIERQDGSLFKGHREWWRKDRKPQQTNGKTKAQPAKSDKPTKLSALEEFLMS